MADIKTDKYKNGMKVVFTADKHKYMPLFYPPAGTKGVIVEADGTDIPRIKWFGFKPFVAGDFRDSAFYSDTDWEVVESTHPKKILITVDKADPQKVVAKDLDSGKTGVAKCNPTDTFDFYTGAKLAFARLCGEDAPKPKCKFKVGDKIVGNKLANRYAATIEGWKGVVEKVYDDPAPGEGCDKGKYKTFRARKAGGDLAFDLSDDAFDLITEPEGWNGKVVCVSNGECRPRACDFTIGKVYAVKDGKLDSDSRAAKYPISSRGENNLFEKFEDIAKYSGILSKFVEYKGEA